MSASACIAAMVRQVQLESGMDMIQTEDGPKPLRRIIPQGWENTLGAAFNVRAEPEQAPWPFPTERQREAFLMGMLRGKRDDALAADWWPGGTITYEASASAADFDGVKYEGFRCKDWSALQAVKDYGSFAAVNFANCKQPVPAPTQQRFTRRQDMDEPGVEAWADSATDCYYWTIAGKNQDPNVARAPQSKPATPNAKPSLKLAIAPLGAYRGLGWCDET